MRGLALVLLLPGCQVVFPRDVPSVCPLPAEPACNPDDPDEDGDGLRDDCDPCPQIANNSEPDADGDGIGDACDPHPGETAACLSRHFFGMSTAAGWLDVTGWSFDGDAFTEDPDLPTGHLTVLRSIDQFGTARVETAIDDGGARGGGSGIAGVATMISADSGYFCGYTQRGFGDASVLLARLTATAVQVQKEGTLQFGVTPGNHHQVTATTSADGTVTCTLEQLGSGRVETVSFTDPMPLTGGSVGIVLESNDANFQYLDVVPD